MAWKAHSRFSPSSARRWSNCPGSVVLSQAFPEETESSKYAAEGSAAHSLAEKYLSASIDALELSTLPGQKIDGDGFGGILVTEEMVGAVKDYADVAKFEVNAMREVTTWKPITMKVEAVVRAASVDDDLWGTVDCLLYRKGDALTVIDFKYGKGVVVEAKENEQLACYALGAMDGEEMDAYDSVRFVIHQPRAPHRDGPVRRWDVDRAWLAAFAQKAKAAIAAARAPDPPLVAGDWCRWCRAAAACPAFSKSLQTAAQVDFAVPPDAPGAMTDPRLLQADKLALALRYEAAILSWYTTLKAHAISIISSGGVIPGFKLVDGRVNRQWIDEAAAAAGLEKSLPGGDFFEPPKLKTPLQIEKLIGKGSVDHLTVKPTAPKRIAPDDDPRPLAQTSAQDDFSRLLEREE